MKPRIAFLLVLPLVFLIIAGSQPSAAGTASEASIPPVPLPIWRGEVAAAGVALTDQGVPGMALDPAGRPHLVYGGNRLFHAWRDGAAWQVETVDPAGGALVGPAIAIDDAGTITIVAYTEAGRQRKELTAYSRTPGGQWQTATIYVPWIGTYPVLALALDGDGRPHVVATGSTAEQRPLLIYAYTSPSGWVSEMTGVDRDPLLRLSLALDSANRPLILYHTDDGESQDDILWLARRDPSGWSHQSLAHSPFFVDKSLSVDSAGKIHIVFSDLQANTRLVYLRQLGNGWQTLVEFGSSYALSLALDAADRPHVAYTNADRDIVYAVLGPEGWERTTIPMVGHGGSHNTLLLDELGVAHISTMQYAQDLYYVTNRGGAWAAMPVAVQDPVGEKHALALDADNRPYLLYYHPSAGQLRWAIKEGDTWATSAVAGVGDSPPDSVELAAAIGPDGVARIAYVDGAADELVVGTRLGSSWSLTPITTAGHNLALAVVKDNRPQLILVQDGRLVYWTQQGGAWQSDPISPAGAAIFNAYLALDGQNRPHVVYTADGVVTAAVRQGEGDWEAERLPVDYMIGMALGPDDALHLLTITFRSEGGKPPTTYYTIWVSELGPGGWVHWPLYEMFETGDNPLNLARLRVDSDGTLHVVSRLLNGWLRYDRHEANGQWSGSDIAGVGDDYGFALAVGSDGQPRISRHMGSDLWLHRREIRWLDKHALLPVVPVKRNTE